MGGQGHYLVALGGQLIGLPAGWGGSCDDLSPSRTGTRALGWLTCWRGSSGSLGQGPCLAACRDPPGHRGVMAAEGSCSQNGAYLSPWASGSPTPGTSHLPWEPKLIACLGLGPCFVPCSCVTFGEIPPLSEPQFPRLCYGHTVFFSSLR